MRRIKTVLIFCVVVGFLCYSCKNAPKIDAAAEEAKILELHELQKTYHIEKMAEELAALLSEDHISVNRGEISRPSREENTARFKRYFNAVEFEKWDDLSSPIVRFSDDYSMAYTIVHKEVIVRYNGENGENMRSSTEFSWVAIYKKHPEGWKIESIASTNKPDVIQKLEK